MNKKMPFSKNENGAAAIEFALVFPLFFLIFYAILTYGMIFVAQQSITLAAAEGARAALRFASDKDRGENAVNAAIGTGSAAHWLAPRLTVDKGISTCPYSSSDNNNAGVRCYTVTVTYAGYALNPLVPLLFGPLMRVVVPSKLESKAIIQID